MKVCEEARLQQSPRSLFEREGRNVLTLWRNVVSKKANQKTANITVTVFRGLPLHGELCSQQQVKGSFPEEQLEQSSKKKEPPDGRPQTAVS